MILQTVIERGLVMVFIRVPEVLSEVIHLMFLSVMMLIGGLLENSFLPDARTLLMRVLLVMLPLLAQFSLSLGTLLVRLSDLLALCLRPLALLLLLT